jgi:hypothetical protein
MIFQRTNRTDPERVFVVVRNNEGAALNKDQTVQWEPASASVDGVRVRDMDTGNEFLFVGIVDAAIADGDYGLVQVYGYRSTSIVFQTGTSQDTGVPLVPAAGQDYLQSVASTTASNAAVTLQPVFAALLESIASSAASATVSRKVFVRAL